MITNYHKADMVKFAQFVDDRSAKGMLFKDKDGRNVITEDLVKDFELSVKGPNDVKEASIVDFINHSDFDNKGGFTLEVNGSMGNMYATHFTVTHVSTKKKAHFRVRYEDVPRDRMRITLIENITK
jgi:hypothetical protein